MPTPRVLILRAPGTNCDEETAFAFERAGGIAARVHINQLLQDDAIIAESQILCLPGGFSYGDDIAAGRILATQIRHHLAAKLREFHEAGKLILGICNGFQILIKSGLLLPDATEGAPATLTWNDSGRFEDRWVHLRVDGNRCVFLAGMERLYLPVAHAEGKLVVRDATIMKQMERDGQLALRYASSDGEHSEQLPYPANPNGSQADVAGVCDASGRVFGLMPHPERHIDPTHHPQWTRRPLPEHGEGLAIFRNAVGYFAEN